MASHPRWCHSVDGWKEQIDGWIETDTWETLRHLLTFVDARTLIGEAGFLEEIKSYVFQKAEENPALLKRMSENTSYLHKGVNALAGCCLMIKVLIQDLCILKMSAFSLMYMQ